MVIKHEAKPSALLPSRLHILYFIFYVGQKDFVDHMYCSVLKCIEGMWLTVDYTGLRIIKHK